MTDDTCPGCDERQARATALIEYLKRHPEETDPLGAALYYLEDG